MIYSNNVTKIYESIDWVHWRCGSRYLSDDHVQLSHEREELPSTNNLISLSEVRRLSIRQAKLPALFCARRIHRDYGQPCGRYSRSTRAIGEPQAPQTAM